MPKPKFPAHEISLRSWRGAERGQDDIDMWEDADHDIGIMDHNEGRSIVISQHSAIALRDWLNAFIERRL